MEYLLRLERPEDERIVDRLTYKAFETMELPGRERVDEHLLAHKLRKAEAFVRELDYVAVAAAPAGEETIVGSILYSRARVEDGEGFGHTVLTFGPLSVLPEWQGRGVGDALVRHTLDEAARLGYRAILIFGHPEYYPRFGFQPAARFGITAPDGTTPDALMACECTPGSLQGIRGKFHPDPVYFTLGEKELMEFNNLLEEQLLGYS